MRWPFRDTVGSKRFETRERNRSASVESLPPTAPSMQAPGQRKANPRLQGLRLASGISGLSQRGGLKSLHSNALAGQIEQLVVSPVATVACVLVRVQTSFSIWLDRPSMSRPRAPDKLWPSLVLFTVILALVFVPFQFYLALFIIVPVAVLGFCGWTSYQKDEY